MARNWRGGAWPFLLVVTFVVGFMLASMSPVNGVTDYFRSGGGTVCTASSFVNPGNACDGNDATAATATLASHSCTAYNDTNAVTSYFDMAASHNITYVRVKFSVPCGTSGGSQVNIFQSPSGCSGQAFYSAGTSQDVVVHLTTGTCASQGRVGVTVWNDGVTGGSTISLYSVEGYTSAPPPPITDYVMNLAIHESLFSRWFTWNWAKDFTGYWTFHRTTDDSAVWSNPTSKGIYQSFVSGNTESNDPPGGAHSTYPSDLCGVGGCTSAGWTLLVHDNATGMDSTYAIAANATGTLIAEVFAPVIGVFSVTYVGSTHVATYLYGWGPSGTVGDVCIGQRGANPLYAPIDTCLVTHAGQTATSTPTSGDQDGTMTLDTSKSNVLVLRIVGKQGTAFRSVTLASLTADGGASSVAPPPATTTKLENCDSVDVACGLRNLGAYIVGGIAAIFEVTVEAFMLGWDKVYSVLIAKQPFAFVLGGLSAATTQLSRATAAVTNSSTCTGVAITMPTLPPITYTAFGATKTVPPTSNQYYAYQGANQTGAPSASPFVFSAMRCADLEPVFGSSWWQGLRTIMTPALMLGYWLKVVRRLEPKWTISA